MLNNIKHLGKAILESFRESKDNYDTNTEIFKDVPASPAEDESKDIEVEVVEKSEEDYNDCIDFSLLDYAKLKERFNTLVKHQKGIKERHPKKFPEPPWKMKWDGRMSGADFEAYSKDPKNRENWNSYYDYGVMSNEVTKICCLLALSRGKLHMTKVRNDGQLFQYSYKEGEFLTLTKKNIVDYIGDYWHSFVK